MIKDATDKDIQQIVRSILWGNITEFLFSELDILEKIGNGSVKYKTRGKSLSAKIE